MARIGIGLVVAQCACAQGTLPELRIEAVAAGSVLCVRNTSKQPLTAFLIELVGYPGSSYAYWFDDPAEPVAAGSEKRIPVTNMLVGAAPDYVKMQGSIYADGGTAGAPQKVEQLLARRRAVLDTTRELIGRLEHGATAADLKQWAGGVKPPARNVIEGAAAELDRRPVAEVLEKLRGTERALIEAKPRRE
jgi:hypothetical protein